MLTFNFYSDSQFIIYVVNNIVTCNTSWNLCVSVNVGLKKLCSSNLGFLLTHHRYVFDFLRFLPRCRWFLRASKFLGRPYYSLPLQITEKSQEKESVSSGEDMRTSASQDSGETKEQWSSFSIHSEYLVSTRTFWRCRDRENCLTQTTLVRQQGETLLCL